MQDYIQFIGQALSFIALITGFISFQMKSVRWILFFQILTAVIFSAHYFLIGATTATMLNLLGAVMCVVYYFRNKKMSKSLITPIFFIVAVCIASFLTWNGWYSVFITGGLLVNVIAFSLSNPQRVRQLTLIKAPLCLLYNIFVFSTGGIIYEIAVIISALLGLWKNRKRTV